MRRRLKALTDMADRVGVRALDRVWPQDGTAAAAERAAERAERQPDAFSAADDPRAVQVAARLTDAMREAMRAAGADRLGLNATGAVHVIQWPGVRRVADYNVAWMYLDRDGALTCEVGKSSLGVGKLSRQRYTHAIKTDKPIVEGDPVFRDLVIRNAREVARRVEELREQARSAQTQLTRRDLAEADRALRRLSA